jgi:hypothetical protein
MENRESVPADESADPLSGMSRLGRRECSRPACRRDANTQATDANGHPIPLCQRHLDDLSWLSMPNDLLSDLPGWSHG